MPNTNPPSQLEDPAILNHRLINLADSTREAALDFIQSSMSKPVTTENGTVVLEILKNTSVMLWKIADTARVVAENERLTLEVEVERLKLEVEQLRLEQEGTEVQDYNSGW